MGRLKLNQSLNKKSDSFLEKLNSEMHYKSELSSNAMTFDWLEEIEFAVPYIDNIVRNPKVALIKEEDVVKIEKAKKISVESIKNLSKNTHFIEKIDAVTNEVQPSKILIERSEETYNTYDNRFIYTLIDRLSRFMIKKERQLDNLEIKDDKTLEYAGTTTTGDEKINIELKITGNVIPKDNAKSIEKELTEIKARIKHINDFILSWKSSEFIKSLQSERASFVTSPIKKTNVILKNPNFQVANKLWGFFQLYDEDDVNSKDNLDTDGDNLIKGIMDDAFLMNYYVLDSMSTSKREQKNKLAEYAIVMINQQIQRIISILTNKGFKVNDQEILELISEAIKNNKKKTVVNSADVKNKFKEALDEYLENINKYL